MTALSLRLGGFTCEGLLGPGGVTETYRALQEGSSGRSVALKLLRGDRGGSDPEIASRFVQAALDLASVSASRIGRIVEVSTAHEAIFAVTELVEGVDLTRLRELVETEPRGLDPQLVGSLGAEIARALIFLHSRPVPLIHGGLCPGNVIVTPAGEVVVLDPGLTASVRALTELPVEKWYFSAPEVLAGEAASAPSDLYSVGAVLFYLLTGRPPFTADTREELHVLAKQGPPAVPDAPPWLAEAITSLLALWPGDRPSSALDVATLLLGAKLYRSRLASWAVRAAGAEPGGLQLVPAPVPPRASAPETVSAQRPLPMPVPGPEASSPFPLAAPDPVPPFPLDLGPAVSLISVEAVVTPSEDSVIGMPMLAPLSLPVDTFPTGQVVPATRMPVIALPDTQMPVFRDSFFDVSGVMERPLSLGELPAMQPAMQPAVQPAVQPAPLEVVDIGAAMRAEPQQAGPPAVGEEEPPQLVAVAAEAPQPEAEAAPPEPAPEPAAGENVALEVPAPTPVWQPPAREGARVERRGVARRPTVRAKATKPGRWRAVLSAAAAVMVVCGLGLALMGGLRGRPPMPAAPPAPPVPESTVVVPKGNVGASANAPGSKTGGGKFAGSLKVVTTPPGGTVWVDGVEKGKSPVTVKTSVGGHRIVITKAGFRMLREVADTADGGALQRVLSTASANFGGNISLNVQCETKGKYPVFVDGRDTGVLCPAEGIKVPPGNHLIGVFVIPQNKIWSFEREIPESPPQQRVIFSY